MTWMVMLVCLVGAALLQVLLPGPAWLGGAKWPLLLGLVPYYALQRDATVLMIGSVAAGLFQDALSALPLGTSAACFLAAAGIISRFRALVLADAVVTQAFFGMATAFTVGLCLYLAVWRLSPSAPSLGRLLHQLLGLALEGAVATPVVFRLAGGLDRLVGNVHATKEVEGVHGDLDGYTE